MTEQKKREPDAAALRLIEKVHGLVASGEMVDLLVVGLDEEGFISTQRTAGAIGPGVIGTLSVLQAMMIDEVRAEIPEANHAGAKPAGEGMLN